MDRHDHRNKGTYPWFTLAFLMALVSLPVALVFHCPALFLLAPAGVLLAIVVAMLYWPTH